MFRGNLVNERSQSDIVILVDVEGTEIGRDRRWLGGHSGGGGGGSGAGGFGARASIAGEGVWLKVIGEQEWSSGELRGVVGVRVVVRLVA